MIKKLFGSIIDIRKGEALLTILMFANYYLLLVTYYFLKPARDSLFLVKVDPMQLPVVFIFTALVTVPVVTLYNKASRSLKLHVLISITTGVLILNLLVLRLLIQWDDPWVYYVFYTWVSIYGALTTSQFWLMANAVYNATQAKRIFVLLGLGGIIGAFTGGEVTGFVVKNLGISTPDLLYFCIGMLVVTIILTLAIRRITPIVEQPRKSRPRKEKKETMGQIFGTIKKSKHLMLIVGIIAMTMMVASFVDYQFKVVSKESFSNTEELTTFLGHFYGRLSLVSLFLQLLFTYRFIRVLGVGGVIMFLPVALLIGSMSVLFVPGLFAVVLLRGADGSLKYSLDKTGRELLFLPVPLEIKKRIKIFIDMFVDRWFRGVAGALLLLCTMVFELSIRQLSLVVLGLVVIWLAMTFIMRKEYVNAFRKALEKRYIDLSSLDVNITDGHAIKTLMTSLASTNDREVLYALDMLKGTQDNRLSEPAASLLTHESLEIRRRAINVLHSQKDDSYLPKVRSLLSDQDPEVRRDAIAFICDNSTDDHISLLTGFLNSEDILIKSAALGCIAKYGNDEEKRLVTEDAIRDLLESEGEHGQHCRLQLARALGTINRPSLRSALQSLMNDPSKQVVRETITSLGKLGGQEHIPWLIDQTANRTYRTQARKALAAYGIEVLPTLKKYILDENVSHLIQQSIPRICGEIPHQESVDLLVELLEQVPHHIRFFIIKTLNKLRISYPDLSFAHQEITDAMMHETRSYYEVLRILRLHRNSDSPSGRLLAQALIEKQDQNLEHIFRLLGLSYPPQDIYNAYLGLTSNRNILRANATEFLDNVLSGEAKKFISPILDDIGAEYTARRGEELFKFTLETTEEALAVLIDSEDKWLKACAIFDAATINSDMLREKIERARTDNNPLIQETVALALNNQTNSD